MEIVFYIFIYFVGYIVSITCLEFDDDTQWYEYLILFVTYPILFIIFIGIILYFCIKTIFSKLKNKNGKNHNYT
jgi:hypothetical protein